MFVALTLLVGLLPTIPGSALKFIGFPLMLGGLLVGPRTGLAVGCLTDLILFSLRPTGFFFPGFTLTQGLTAMLPGLLSLNMDPLTGRALKSQDGPAHPTLMGRHLALAFFRILAIFALTKLLTSVLLVSYFTSLLTNIPVQTKLIETALIQAWHVPVYALMALLVLQSLAQTDLYPRLLKARR
jgi:ECF transporter S component (folate family)